LKRFYRWQKGLPKDKDPPETEWIKISNSNGKQILPEELLIEDDVQKMLTVCENSRDRAFLLSIFETGGRIAEVLNLRRKHVRFDDLGAVFAFSRKRGDRPARIIQAAPALSQWMNDHPDKDPESPLWLVIGIKSHGEPMLYDGARKLLRRLAKCAGVKKRVNPQSFRYAGASYLAHYMTERQMESYLGWSVGSKMPRIYVHLSGRDLDPVLSRINGIETKIEAASEKPKLTPKICPRCHQKSIGLDRFCSSCGLPLDRNGLS
jgi:integrase/recombinase XerD